MRLAFALLALLCGCSKQPEFFTPDPSTAVTITGRISVRGTVPKREKLRIDEDPVCPKLNPNGLFEESIVAGPNGELANAFVYVRDGIGERKFAIPAEPVVIDQKNCRFQPHVLAVRVGQTVRVLNSDPLTHNIHPQPRQNREWNQSQPEGAEALVRKFVRPEVMMRVKCNVHSWMRGYISVMEHPYFAVTEADGSFNIRDLPPGKYTVEVRHEKLGSQEASVELGPAASKSLNFVFEGVKPQ